MPCALNHPSCEGKQDGVYQHGYKSESPWFMVCKDERFVSDGLCPPDPILHVESRVYEGECTSLYNIPKDKGGIMPDCSELEDGSYTEGKEETDIYFRCEKGETTVLRCPAGQIFDKDTENCK